MAEPEPDPRIVKGLAALKRRKMLYVWWVNTGPQRTE
ncbi:unnamed protein product, partial [marine sediment metagenome]